MRRMVFSSGHMHNVLAVILQPTSETSSNRGDSFLNWRKNGARGSKVDDDERMTPRSY